MIWWNWYRNLSIYCISGNFCDDLILAFFVISIESQIIEDAEIIFCIIFLKKLFKSQNDWRKLEMLHISQFLQILWHAKNLDIRYYLTQ